MDDYKDDDSIEIVSKRSLEIGDAEQIHIDGAQFVQNLEKKIHEKNINILNFIQINLGNICPKVDEKFINIILDISEYSIEQEIKIWDYILSGTKDNLNCIKTINIVEYFISLLPYAFEISSKLIEYDQEFQQEFIKHGIIYKINECVRYGQYKLTIARLLESLSTESLGDYEIHDCLFEILSYLFEQEDEVVFHTLIAIRNICKNSKYRNFGFTALLFNIFERCLESKELLVTVLSTLSQSVTLDQEPMFDTAAVYEKLIEVLSFDDEDVVLSTLDFVESIIVEISKETQPDSSVINRILECASEGTIKIKESSTMILVEIFKICIDECAVYLLENQLIPLILELFDYGNEEQKSEALSSLRRITTLYDDIPDDLLDQLKELYDAICDYIFEDDYVNHSIELLKRLLDSYCC